MDTQMGGDREIDAMRREHLTNMALALAAKMREAMIAKSREQGLVATPQVTRMCSDLANLCADVAMREMAVLQTHQKLHPDDVPVHLRNGTTQTIIDEVAAPLMAAEMAAVMLKSGLVRPALSIPHAGDPSVTFTAWGVMLRQSGPAGLSNAPRLYYNARSSVFTRPDIELPSAEARDRRIFGAGGIVE